MSYRNKKSRSVFVENKKKKMPLVVLGSGMVNKSHVKFRGKMVGAVGKIVEHLLLRQSRGELFVLMIDEYLTSQVIFSQTLILHFIN